MSPFSLCSCQCSRKSRLQSQACVGVGGDSGGGESDASGLDHERTANGCCVRVGDLLVCRCRCIAQNTRATPTYKRIKQKLDAIPAIDTHDHLFPFDRLPCIEETKQGRGVNLAGLWHNSYYRRFNPLTAWKPGMDFDEWWQTAKHDFKDARATSFYRYQLPAFQDLYGVDFDQITDAQARDLDRRIFENYKNQKWLYHVVTERANIELMLNDPYWARYAFTTSYPWEVLVFNVTPLTRGFHASEFTQAVDSPYEFAKKHGLPVDTLDDYLKVLDRLFLEAKDRGAVCLKSTLAYQRTLSFDNVPRERANKAFGRRQSALSSQEIKDFEDFIMWRLCELSAKYELPFSDPHGRRPHPGLQSHVARRSDPGQPEDPLHPVPRRLPVDRRDRRDRDAPRLERLDRLMLAPHNQLHDRQAGLPRMAGGHALKPHHVGSRLQPCRGNLRRHGIHPPLPGRSPRRESRPGRFNQIAGRPHRSTNPPRQCTRTFPATEVAALEADGQTSSAALRLFKP